MRTVFQWNLGKRALELGKRTLIMGVVNVTPDSFFDGGRYLDSGKAAAHGLQLLEDGADIIDVGENPPAPVPASPSHLHRRKIEIRQQNKSRRVASRRWR